MDELSLISEADRLIPQGRIQSAIVRYEAAVSRAPQLRPVFHYNLGYVSEQLCGIGTDARRHYEQAHEALPASRGFVPSSMIAEVEANATENLLFFCLSYDEFEGLADRLAQLQPTNPIHRVMRADVHDLRDKGHPWKDVLIWLAASFYNFEDPSRDPGHHGKAAAVYQLILENQVALRMSNDECRNVTGVYGALMIKVYWKHKQAMEHAVGSFNAEEVKPIVQRATPYLENCLKKFPAEDRIREGLNILNRLAQESGTPIDPVSQLSRGRGCALVPMILCAAAYVGWWLF